MPGATRAQIYPPIFPILAGLLVRGSLVNFFVRPVGGRWRIEDEAIESGAGAAGASAGIHRGRFDLPTALARAVVGLLLLWGISITLSKALVMFR